MTPQARDGAGSPLPIQARLAGMAQQLAAKLEDSRQDTHRVELDLVDVLVALMPFSDFDFDDFVTNHTHVEISTMRSYRTALQMFPPDDRAVADPKSIIPVSGWRHAYDNTETDRRAGLPKAKTLAIMAEYVEKYFTGEWQEISGSIVRTTLSSLRRRLEYERSLHAGDDDNSPSVGRFQYPELCVTDIRDELDRFLSAAGVEMLPEYDTTTHEYYVWVELVEKRKERDE